jgi:hypothetical protein
MTLTMSDIKLANAAAGNHWFEPATLRFFRSRVGDTVYQGPGGVYFVSSEQFVDSRGNAAERLFTVRKFNPETGDINTASEFNKLTRSAAITQARKLAKG